MSSPDEHPRCADVFAYVKWRPICLNNCASYRKRRPEGDLTFCSQQVLAFIGNVGECAYTRRELEAPARNVAMHQRA